MYVSCLIWKLLIFQNNANNKLLEYDITRRDPLSVVMDAGSRIVNFIRDGPSDNPEIYNIGAHAQWFRVNRHPWQWTRRSAEVTNGLQ